MVGRAAGDNINLVEVFHVGLAQVLLVQHHAAVPEVACQCVTHSCGLLMNFLHHEGVVATLFCSCQVPVDAEGLALGRASIKIENLVTISGDNHHIVLVKLDGILRVFDESSNVRAQEHLVITHANDQWSGAATGDDLVWMISMHHQQRESTLQAAQH